MGYKELLEKAYRRYSEDGGLQLLATTLVFIADKLLYCMKEVNYYTEMFEAVVEYSEETQTPMQRCIPAIRHGFKPKTYAILGLRSKDPTTYESRSFKKYIGEDHPGPIAAINKNSRYVLNDKLATYRVFDNLGEYFPAIYGTIHDGRYDSWDEGETQSLRDAVETYDTVVAKPVSKSQGRGFYKLVGENGYHINGEEAEVAGINDLQRSFDYRDYLVTEYVHQHSYANRIFPGTTNTIRFHTVMNAETGEPYATRAAHRFGTTASAPVDNYSNGGLLAPVDVDSGELGRAIVLGENGNRHRRDTHPDTGARITGVKVPRWDEAKSLALEGARSYPMARMIGWDVVITDEGPKILEASGHPDPIGTQLERGLLTDPVIKQVLEMAE